MKTFLHSTKVLLVVLLSFLSNKAFGQTIIDNTATGALIPSGWTGINNVTAQGIQQTASGGYYLVERTNPNIDYLLSNAYSTINGASEVNITFDIATYGASTTTALNVDMSLDGGTTWTSTQTSSPSVNSSTYKSSNVVFTGPISSSNVRFRFYDPVTGVPSVRIQNIVISIPAPVGKTVTFKGNGANAGGTGV